VKLNVSSIVNLRSGKNLLLRTLGRTVQAVTVVTDLLTIGALVATAIYFHWAVALILLYVTHQSMRSTGGWFFAWKKENREAFMRNWNEMNDCA
jgi:hypothetical protein